MAIESWRRTLGRVRAMDRREFVDRSRQELARRADATLSHLNYDFTRNLLSSSTARPRAFFFKPEQVPALLDLIWERLPKQAERVLSRAQKICSHRFDLLGYADLDYGDLINWHLDVVHAKQAPLKAFYRVKYLDFAEVGDSKITWELNRHQHLVTLAKALRTSSRSLNPRSSDSRPIELICSTNIALIRTCPSKTWPAR